MANADLGVGGVGKEKITFYKAGVVDIQKIRDLLDEKEVTRKELASLLGVSVITITAKLTDRSGISNRDVEKLANLFSVEPEDLIKKENIGEVFAVERRPDISKVDVELLKEKITEFDYLLKDVAEVIGLAPTDFYARLGKRVRFRHQELEELEDLFFLEEGELLK